MMFINLPKPMMSAMMQEQFKYNASIFSYCTPLRKYVLYRTVHTVHSLDSEISCATQRTNIVPYCITPHIRWPKPNNIVLYCTEHKKAEVLHCSYLQCTVWVCKWMLYCNSLLSTTLAAWPKPHSLPGPCPGNRSAYKCCTSGTAPKSHGRRDTSEALSRPARAP